MPVATQDIRLINYVGGTILSFWVITVEPVVGSDQSMVGLICGLSNFKLFDGRNRHGSHRAVAWCQRFFSFLDILNICYSILLLVPVVTKKMNPPARYFTVPVEFFESIKVG
jgi:hypothetical protein